MPARAFDPAALERHRQFLGDLIDELENDILPSLRDGALRKAPAFGTAPGATAEYADFHATTWRNLQYLRATLHGLRARLQSAIDNDGTIDPDTATEILRLTDGDDLYT
ncbi:hypothetical protein [Glycomyces terrestris]|uniref:Uncharacterized protein n=1 Tax=Glycomyces terrestris TaxID=2493553 RepID=A0A426UY14_9ACTN|nr:hypothetical protein [Glycomyces terrestris]RRR99459.1 hypothetical protein EIW28_12185 [Glycomyces terrestris]